MIEVDGSIGEGGGQVLRTSIALSALLGEPVKIFNIRAKRSPPGLKAQHITGVKAVASLVGAEVEGLELGSQVLTFVPKERRGGSFSFDVGTAGSISLVLQALLPAAAFAPSPVELTVRGGTDVKWAPPIDYMKHVFAPIMAKMGYSVSIEVVRRGHYPRGGGIVKVRANPVSTLSPLRLEKRGAITRIRGISHCVRLPSHVAKRQAYAAYRLLKEEGFGGDLHIDVESYPPNKDPHLGPGSGIVLWAETDRGCVLGADALGERGKPAEQVGEEAAGKLLKELRGKATVDIHMADMLIPYMAIADGESVIRTRELTLHAFTNIKITEMITGVKFEVQGTLGAPAIIRVKGISFTG